MSIETANDLTIGAPSNSLDAWEAAYVRFETPREEIAKFVARLQRLGQAKWARDAQIVELFCGRGNGLHALESLGFTNLEGVDLSAALVHRYNGRARMYVADCRTLPFADASRDILIVQGGLHHLPNLPDDLERTLIESRRVLRPGGAMVIVEPWLTPYLSFVHTVCQWRAARRLYYKVDALATMIEHERRTYEQWLGQPQTLLPIIRRYFTEEQGTIAWGKLAFVGRVRGDS